MSNDPRSLPEVIARRLKPIPLPPLPGNPLVSLLTPNYNYARFIGEAIESVQKQTYSNWEMIICDDGSEDDSCEIVESFASRDARIKLIRQQKGGVASALNAAYAIAKGDLIALLDVDDVWLPKRLKLSIAAFKRRPDAGMATHYLELIEESGRRLRRRNPERVLSQGWCGPALALGRGLVLPPTSALTLRAEVATRIFPLPREFTKRCDTLIRDRAVLLAHVVAVGRVLGLYRVHDHNVEAFMPTFDPRYAEQEALWDQKCINAFREFAFETCGIQDVGEGDAFGTNRLPILCRAVLEGVRPSYAEILSSRRGIYRYLWMLAFALPGPLARRVYAWCRGSRHSQYLVRRVLGTLQTLSERNP